MREPVELEVIQAQAIALEGVQYVRQRVGFLDCAKCESRNAGESDLRNDADCAQSEAARFEQLDVFVGACGNDGSVGENDLDSANLCGDTAESCAGACVPVDVAPASDWTSMSPRFAIAYPRCHKASLRA